MTGDGGRKAIKHARMARTVGSSGLAVLQVHTHAQAATTAHTTNHEHAHAACMFAGNMCTQHTRHVCLTRNPTPHAKPKESPCGESCTSLACAGRGGAHGRCVGAWKGGGGGGGSHVDPRGDARGSEGDHLQRHERRPQEHVLLKGSSPWQQGQNLGHWSGGGGVTGVREEECRHS